jgi:hypothetical protein
MPNILTLGKEGKADDVMRDVRVRSLWSPYYFTRVCLGYHDLVPHLHGREMDRFVENCERGVRKHWIEWPRGFFKTTCFTVGCGMWFNLPHTDADARYAIDVLGINEEAWFKRMALHNQDWLNLLAFETFANAKKKVGIIRHHFEATELFRAAFSPLLHSPRWKLRGY